jgi:uridine phosphorylase
MPSRLRPTAPVAADAILVGDPGRALLLAQELLEQPRMSNHARGLWGYTGSTPEGQELTIQSTGMGGPSAALVLADLAKLGVRRAVRIGTCVGAEGIDRAGGLLLAAEAIAGGGSSTSLGIAEGEAVAPDHDLLERLRAELGESARATTVASLDTMATDSAPLPAGADAADMQTVAVLAGAQQLGIEAGAVLIVAETAGGARRLGDEELAEAAKLAGRAVARVLSG